LAPSTVNFFLELGANWRQITTIITPQYETKNKNLLKKLFKMN
jgi:hypothetical protein